MKIRLFFVISSLFVMFSFFGLSQQKYEVEKSDQEWKNQLTEMSYLVLRKAYTERPYTGKYDKSDRKYNSNCGWPSFDMEIKGKLIYDVDYKLGYPRTEIKCKKCGGHLGHVFKDGPKETTGIRHCVNSVALVFKKT